MPRVSIVIPCFNAEQFLAATLDSVRRQTLRDWEIVAVDDGSRDGTAALLDRYAKLDRRLTAVHQENGGVSAARNRGFSLTDRSSRYLLFLDADDVLRPDMLESITTFLDRHTEYGAAFCNRAYIDGSGKRIRSSWKRIDRWAPAGALGRRLREDEAITPFPTLFLDGVIVPSCTVLRRDVYESSPGWDETLGQPYEDTDLFQFIALTHKIAYLPTQLVAYRVHATQSMANQRHALQQRRRCYEKWLQYQRVLPAEQRATIAAAISFQRRILPLRLIVWAWDEARRGHLYNALRHGLRAGKAIVANDWV